MKNYILLTLVFVITSCSTVGAVIEGGVDLGASVIDSTVSTAGNVTAAALHDVSDVVGTVADATQDVVDVVVENVDQQTDEIQSEKEE